MGVMRKLLIILSILFFISCQKQSEMIELRFLDEYVLPDSLLVFGTLVGGLSGIDYDDGIFYIVADDAKGPRFYETTISAKADTISSVIFNKLVQIKDTTKYYDLESILFEKGTILLTSEGLIREEKDPTFFSVNQDGEVLNYFELPDYYKATSTQRPRTNGVFEGLTRSFDKKGYWIITELPLETDGIAPTAERADSPVRLTYFNKETYKAEKQFVYQLDRISKMPLGDFGVNGVTDLLAYASNKFLVIERSYSSGYGNNGNDIKIYDIDLNNATNTLDILSLMNTAYTPVTKRLLFDFDSVRDQLTNAMIDNVEGITFGPQLENGNQSLVLVVDNDFNKQGNRLNQFILMEFKK